MKTWNETRDVLTAAKSCLAAGHACVIVVLTNVKGSAFRRPGAKLLIRDDGTMTGNVSGGCLENDLRERAMQCLASGEQATVHYDTGSDEDVIWGLGLGCDGEMDLLLIPIAGEAIWMDEALALMAQDKPFTMSWPPGSEAFVDVLEPPPSLFVVGAGDDAIPLVRHAQDAGFRITVIDHRPGYLSAERFPGVTQIALRPEQAAAKLSVDARALVVIKNHALEMDKKWAAWFDATEACYIGLLGPHKRCDQVKEQMTSGNMARVYGPAGLDLGAEGAEQIAVSIVAEMLAVWSGRPVIHLRDRKSSIHAR